MDVTWVIFLFLIGACIGSFLNVVIHRLPEGQSIAFPPSHCPSCGRRIQWYDNIPLVSWFVLKGRCRACRVTISPRYVVVEAVTACLFAGLYVCYYVLDLRDDSGTFADSWPMFAAHVTLLAALLACAIVDIEKWLVPLEVCWFASLVGIAVNAADPHPWVSPISPAIGAMSLAAAIGLGVGLLALRYGWIQRSFIDAELPPPAKDEQQEKGPRRDDVPTAVAVTSQQGVNPRKEVLREVLFLGPAIVLAATAWVIVTYVPSARGAWDSMTAGAGWSRHVSGLVAALFGYLIGGAWIWGTRILGTLAFGKEAMGLGDVHILAAVGAVAGWIVPSIAFFVAPLFGLLWALYLLLARNQRELPYGPWLAAATLVVLLFYDLFTQLLSPYRDVFAP
jgi:leader peptidase (prepilin peptidase)/N-methyltransferase